MNNPSVIANIRKQYSSLVTGTDDPLDPLNPRREETSPIVKTEIADMIYKKDNLKKLYLRQSLKPLETYLSKSKEERADLAKQRVVQTTKRLSKVQELANPNASQATYSVSPSRYGSVTMLQSHIDGKTTGGNSKMLILEDQTLLMSKKNLNSKKSLLNVESK